VLADLPENKVGRNTVTSGGPVTVTVTEPIPCHRSREDLSYVCLASGNQRRSCYRSRSSLTVPKKKLRAALPENSCAIVCSRFARVESWASCPHLPSASPSRSLPPDYPPSLSVPLCLAHRHRCNILKRSHPRDNPGANLKSISHRCYLFVVAFVWELSKETIVLPMGCLQGGRHRCNIRAVLNEGQSQDAYRGTSLIRNSAPLGPYSRNMPRALWWS